MVVILVTELEEWVLLRLVERALRNGRSVALEILRELEREEAPDSESPNIER